jgi:hypothetical protein
MMSLRLVPHRLMSLVSLASLGWWLEASAAVVNIDFQGVRNVPGPDVPGPVYSGPSAAGVGTSWNGLNADSRLPDGSDDDNLNVAGANLVDESGLTTGVGFTLGPVGGDVCCAAPVTDPLDPLALFNDYIFNNSAGNSAGQSPFTISGLGENATVDLYFYKRSGSVTIEGGEAAEFVGEPPFTPANTTYFKDVPVSNGQVTGSIGGGVAVLWGLSISAPGEFGTPAAPIVESASPAGKAVRTNAVVEIKLRDKATAVVPGSIQLLLNGTSVSPQITRDAGTGLTLVSYDPKGALPPDSTQVVRIIFGSDAVPAVVQTNEFSFAVFSDLKAALVINVDFDGARTGDEIGVTYSGQGAGGGGTIWNGITVDSRLPDGTDDDNLNVSSSGLVDSLGGVTSVSFGVNPVGGDVGGTPTTDPTVGQALFSDYFFNNSAGNTAGESPFVISGLGSIPSVDLYFYRAVGTISVAGIAPASMTPNGLFTAGNTVAFRGVPVVGGSVSGNFGPGVTVINGLSIVKPLPQPIVKSLSPIGDGVLGSAEIRVELQDNVTQVDPASIQLTLNGQPVVPTVVKPAGSEVTTVTYDPPGRLPADSTNVVNITFSDRSTPPVVQTRSFSFTIFNEVKASSIVNIDFNGVRNVPGPDELGPTYAGVGAAGGGMVWNGITADSRIEGGGDDDNLTVEAAGLLDSMGGTTTIAFTVGPMGGDVGGAPTTNPSTSQALYSDYIFNNSAGNSAGQSPFVITGLGQAPTVDLYFYRSAGTITVADVAPSAITPSGLFTGANTTYFRNVPVLGGSVSGNFGPGTTVINGLTIVKPLPQPMVKSVAPTGDGVPGDAIVQIELMDYVTQVDPSSIRLSVNGQAVTPSVAKPAGSDITTVTFDPPGDLPGDSLNLAEITFADGSNPPVIQTRSFSFSVLNVLRAATIVNIDFNGARHPDELGPTYSGTSAPGGGMVWNGLTADSRLEDGTDDDNLTVAATDLLNSLGRPTTIAFSVSPMGGDVGGSATTDPTAREALFSDYIFNKSAGNSTDESPFTITGLGSVPFVDLYFYRNNGGVSVAGLTRTPFAPRGIFTAANTYYYRRVPVINGQVDGLFGPGTAVVNGLTIVIPGALSVASLGNDVLVSWSGSATLQSAPDVKGDWTELTEATSPLRITPSEARRFYRLRP